MDNMTEKEVIIQNYNRLLEQSKMLTIKIDVAIEGLKTLISQGDLFGIAQKTLDEMGKIKNNLSDDNSKDMIE
tara:strand:+ start:533 stop:751 length:219 start_codon:yes stop_codon:yes gene_type:complete